MILMFRIGYLMVHAIKIAFPYCFLKDNRLYKSIKTTDSWSLIASTADEWSRFPKQFENSTITSEIKFHDYLTENLVPIIMDSMLTKEKEKEMEVAMINRKRSNRVLRSKGKRSSSSAGGSQSGKGQKVCRKILD
jgi:hypothetical protein